MFEKFRSWNPRRSSLALIKKANEIINDFAQEGYTLTLRQLYYQFVGQDLIPNTERSYKSLGSIVNKARLAGLMSWEAIEDRNRSHVDFWTCEDPLVRIKNLPYTIRFDQWKRQPYYVEVWVEKEALGNVISKACNPWLVPHLSCKGYLSASEMWRAGQRFENAYDQGKDCLLIHLGDHDPSGIDMTRDNAERLKLLSHDTPIEVKRIALNSDQIEDYSPPPNPAKLSDSRATNYIKRYGRKSWELDALKPRVIEKLITDELENIIDHAEWDDTLAEESEVEQKLQKLGDNWEAVDKFLRGIE